MNPKYFRTYSIWGNKREPNYLKLGTEHPIFRNGTAISYSPVLYKVFKAKGWNNAVNRFHKFVSSFSDIPE